MKSIIEPSAIFLALLWCLAAAFTPSKPVTINPTAATISPVLITEAADHIPDAGKMVAPAQATVSRETGPGESFTKPAETSPVAPNLPPMQVGLDAAPEPARGSGAVATHATVAEANSVPASNPPAAAPYRPVYRQPVYRRPVFRRRLFGRFR